MAKPRRPRGVRGQDPFLERERESYPHPLPSREFILQVLEEAGAPLPLDQLAARLEITPEEEETFSRRIAAMERDGQIIRNRRGALGVLRKMDLITGKVQGHPDGFGFLLPDDGSSDLTLSPREMHKVLHGDRVVVRETGVDRRGRREGSVVEVLERANQRLVARFYREQGVSFAEAENRRISQDILIPAGGEHGAQPGQVVMVEIVQQPTSHNQAIGRVVEILGSYADPGMEIEIALRKHDLPHEFSPEVEKACARFPEGVTAKDLKDRRDLRDLPLVTIDGETAKDFDDAVYCEPKGKAFKLWVCIADVSHYVRPGDPLDREALLRGNSVYFPRRVIPMLPEVLSNGLCSLNPQVDRLCMACEMEVDPRGEIRGYEFYPAVMHSRARLTYTAVAGALEETGPSLPELLPHLNNLRRIYQALAQSREKRGAIDFETVESEMIFNDQGKIENIVPALRNQAHRIIEECMLAANVCASDFLQSRGHPTLYRIHEGPTPEKLEALREFLKEFGLQLSGGDDPQAKDYAQLLGRIKGRPDAQLLQTVMLRSLRQAVYSPDNAGHFGLAYESYTHFTSPIRRYPDLLVHRAIKSCLQDAVYTPGDWGGLGVHCSMTERRADDATRDVVAWLKCYFMQDKVNQSFEGTVSGVTGFGLFVALDGVYVEGLVHVSELGSDYFHFDAAKHRLLGERTGARYRLGDRIRVRVARVDLETARIDFTLAESGRTGRSGKGGKKK